MLFQLLYNVSNFLSTVSSIVKGSQRTDISESRIVIDLPLQVPKQRRIDHIRLLSHF